MQGYFKMEQHSVSDMKRQIIKKLAKTGLDLAQAYNDMPTGSSVWKSIKVAITDYGGLSTCQYINTIALSQCMRSA